jgi:excinuclease ABC subunit A
VRTVPSEAIKTDDWIIDLGPEGGDGGGTIVAAGSPEDVVKVKESYTGQYLKPVLARNKAAPSGRLPERESDGASKKAKAVGKKQAAE